MSAAVPFTFEKLWACLAEHYGERPVMIAEDGSPFDAAAVFSLVEALARLLSAHGVGPGKKVAFFADNHVEYLAAIWATWRLGGIVVPLDVLTPPEVLSTLLEELAPCALFVDRERRQVGTRFRGPTWCFDDPTEEEAGAWPQLASTLAPYWDAPSPPFVTGPSQAAMALLFTSGTTGRPKGCLLSQEALIRSAWNMSHSAGWGAGDRLLSTGGFHTIAGLRNAALAGPLRGMTLILGGLSAPGSAWRIVEWATAFDATVLAVVPTFLQFLLAYTEQSSASRLESVRQVFVGGSSLQAQTAVKLEAHFQFELWTYYGQTETGGRFCKVPGAASRERTASSATPSTERSAFEPKPATPWPPAKPASCG